MFYSALTKKSKHFLRSMVTAPSLSRASMLNTTEAFEKLRGKYQANKIYEEKEEEYVEANKLIWVALENDSPKSAVY